MSVVNVIPKWSIDGSPAKLNAEGGVETEATRGWTVECSSFEDDAVVARQADGIPRPGDRHPSDPYMRCLSVTPTRIGTSCLFEIVAQYGLPPGNTSQINPQTGKPVQNPLDMPAKISWSSRMTNEPTDVDADGKPILNTAGIPWDPPLVGEFYETILTITRNERFFDDLKMEKFRGKSNADIFFRRRPRCVKCENINGSDTFEMIDNEPFRYAQVMYQFAIRDFYEFKELGSGRTYGPWDRRVLSAGFVEQKFSAYSAGGYPTSDSVRILSAIVDFKTGQPVSSPVPLDFQGRAVPVVNLTPDEVAKMLISREGGTSPGSGLPYWCHFRKCPAINFSELGLE